MTPKNEDGMDLTLVDSGLFGESTPPTGDNPNCFGSANCPLTGLLDMEDLFRFDTEMTASQLFDIASIPESPASPTVAINIATPPETVMDTSKIMNISTMNIGSSESMSSADSLKSENVEFTSSSSKPKYSKKSKSIVVASNCSVGELPQPVKSKRKKTNKACIACRKAKVQCDTERPCKRCVKRKVGHLCADAPTISKPIPSKCIKCPVKLKSSKPLTIVQEDGAIKLSPEESPSTTPVSTSVPTPPPIAKMPTTHSASSTAGTATAAPVAKTSTSGVFNFTPIIPSDSNGVFSSPYPFANNNTINNNNTTHFTFRSTSTPVLNSFSPIAVPATNTMNLLGQDSSHGKMEIKQEPKEIDMNLLNLRLEDSKPRKYSQDIQHQQYINSSMMGTTSVSSGQNNNVGDCNDLLRRNSTPISSTSSPFASIPNTTIQETPVSDLQRQANQIANLSRILLVPGLPDVVSTLKRIVNSDTSVVITREMKGRVDNLVDVLEDLSKQG